MKAAYLSWPLRMLFGEKPFASEVMTLIKPVEVYLFLLFKLHPSMTFYEFRLLGWFFHLLSFAVLATYLFRLSGAPLQSPLIAGVPFFVCHIFGLAEPGYNTLSCDFLLIALCLQGFSTLMEMNRGCPWAWPAVWRFSSPPWPIPASVWSPLSSCCTSG